MVNLVTAFFFKPVQLKFGASFKPYQALFFYNSMSQRVDLAVYYTSDGTGKFAGLSLAVTHIIL